MLLEETLYDRLTNEHIEKHPFLTDMSIEDWIVKPVEIETFGCSVARLFEAYQDTPFWTSSSAQDRQKRIQWFENIIEPALKGISTFEITHKNLRGLKKRIKASMNSKRLTQAVKDEMNSVRLFAQHLLDFGVEQQVVILSNYKQNGLKQWSFDKTRPLTPMERKIVLEAIQIIRPDMLHVFSIISSAGLSMPEVRALCWEDIDLEQKVVTIQYSLGSDGNRKPLSKPRKVYLSHSDMVILTKLKPASNRLAKWVVGEENWTPAMEGDEPQLVFSDEMGGPYSVHNFNSVLKRATKNSSIGEKTMRAFLYPSVP